MTDDELKEKIVDARFRVAVAESALLEYLKACTHEIKNIKRSVYDGAVCDICNEGFGWYCEESPDHTCHYYSNNGFVRLIDGKTVAIPESILENGYNPDSETEDECLFCGMPAERK